MSLTAMDIQNNLFHVQHNAPGYIEARDRLLQHDAAQRQRIVELERQLEQYAWTISPAMAQAKIIQLEQEKAALQIKVKLLLEHEEDTMF